MQDKHPLASLFEARSVAVVGASEREHSAGKIVFRHLLDGAYTGRLYPVNPKHDVILGIPAYKTLEEIGTRVELAIAATPPATLPDIVKQCGRSGIRNLLILTGFSGLDEAGAKLERKTLKIARSLGIRVLGPNSAGLLRPDIGLRACLCADHGNAGGLALVAQSSALCASVLDRAADRRSGFSCVISPGEMADIDLGEILDYLANDARTLAILLQADTLEIPAVS